LPAIHPLLDVNRERKKSASGRASGRPTAVARIMVSPERKRPRCPPAWRACRLEDDLLSADLDGHRGCAPGCRCTHVRYPFTFPSWSEGGGLSQPRPVASRAELAQTSTFPLQEPYRRRPSSLMRAR
jgi:hypothetical protein